MLLQLSVMVSRKYFRLIGPQSSKKDFAAFSFLLVNTLCWYFITLNVLDNLLTNLGGSAYQTVVIKASYNLAIILSGFCGAFISTKIKRRDLLLIWIIFGIVASLLPFIIVANSMESVTLFSAWFGSSFGFGMPSCLSYFTDGTVFESRARSAGLIFFLASLFAAVFVLSDILSSGLLSISFYLAIWRSSSLCIFVLPNLRKIEANRTERTSFRTILGNRPFLFYLIPWSMFALVDALEKAYLQSYIQIAFGESFFSSTQFVETVIGSLSALAGGFVADIVGRTRVVVYGFVSLGIAYAIVGLAPFAQLPWHFYSVVDGFAWGTFFVMFIFVIWGDLSPPKGTREKYFVLSSVPYFLAKVIGAIFLPLLRGFPKESTYATFSLAAFFLFLAVIPLMYAPETLPEKSIQDRELRQYVEKAKKTKDKYI
jgi:MFS family permease